MLPIIIRKFFRWYDRYDNFNTIFAAFLFSIQAVHLLWLTTDVVLPRLLGTPYFFPHDLFHKIIAIVDYTEIPALISTSLLLIRSFRINPNRKDFIYLVLLNIQWLHIFWITDEIVHNLIGDWNFSLAWIAIVIDYLELPIIVELIFRSLKITGKIS